jgi:hypothetical protein
MEYYVFPTQAEAQDGIDAINNSGWFPIVGKRNGVPDPTAQATTCWVESATEMTSGEWAIQRIPEPRLDYLDVSQENRDNFLAAFGQDIRELTSADFHQPVGDI